MARILLSAAYVFLVVILTAGCVQEQDVRQASGKQLSNAVHYSVSMGANKNLPKSDADGADRHYEEVQPPSGTWTDGRGIGSAIAAGYKKPGEEVSALLHIIESEKAKGIEARTIRYKLTERDRQGQLIRGVAEHTEHMDLELAYSNFSSKLPDREGTYYLLTVEIMDGNAVEDTVLSLLTVPVQKVEAVLTLDQTTYFRSAKPVLTMLNTGPAPLFFGLDYKFERKEGDDWTVVPTGKNIGVEAIGYELTEGGEWEQTIEFKYIPPGQYRIGKTVNGQGTSIEKTVFAEFAVR
ncbi:immunoglobulin-like domain-containing protein [Paenibacillus sp. GCM10012303]|uniref:immunoglobulin-like domain-containing protein n=1 Tax=Paenibacillus sp. GCM10012303 TaxID=3317340 RepID=UPI003607DD9D